MHIRPILDLSVFGLSVRGLSIFGPASRLMRTRRYAACCGVAAATFAAVIFAVAAPTAHAFTIEGEEAGSPGSYEVPKFDLEEQSRNFRREDAAGSSGSRSEFNTPFGKGALQFGVQQGAVSNFGFGSALGPGWGAPRPLVTRDDFERMVTPENLR